MPPFPIDAAFEPAATHPLLAMAAISATHDTPSDATGMLTALLEHHSHLKRMNGLSMSTSVNASAILAMEQRHTIHVLATTTSTLTIATVLIALYWFFMMRRNFRRDLVLLLIVGDFWKSMVYWLFAIVTFVNGPVMTTSNFCQATGFFLTQGLELCDMAILLISLHMYLQIFPPAQSFLGHDGLYRIRYWVGAAWFLIPTMMASLAFINPREGYQATGAFCTLPIRPYWYRLALSWIPRYLMWIFVMGVAIRIYRHVAGEFRVFGYERDRSSSMEMPGLSSVARAAQNEFMASQRRRSVTSENVEKQHTMDDDVAPDDLRSMGKSSSSPSNHSPIDSSLSLKNSPSRRASSTNWSVAFGFATEPIARDPTRSPQSSRRPSRVLAPGVVAADFAPTQTQLSSHPRPSIITMNSTRSVHTLKSNPDLLSPLAPIKESDNNRVSTSGEPTPAQPIADKTLQTRRRAIQRQLRLLFIYPVVYMIMWVIPFVSHAMSYSDYYAQHPIYAISALSTFCQCFMGFTDVVIFSWRERPWRHIPGSDGTFLGSFLFWRFCFGDLWTDSQHRRESRAPSDVLSGEKEAEPSPSNPDTTTTSETKLLNSLKRWSAVPKETTSRNNSLGPSVASRIHRRAHSGGSDRKQLEADLAHQRLAMERQDWEERQKERRETVVSIKHPNDLYKKASRQAATEWWDRQLESDLFHDDESAEGSERGGGGGGGGVQGEKMHGVDRELANESGGNKVVEEDAT